MEYRDRYFAVHEKADTVTMISNYYTADCYEKAERYMRERGDIHIHTYEQYEGLNKPG